MNKIQNKQNVAKRKNVR